MRVKRTKIKSPSSQEGYRIRLTLSNIENNTCAPDPLYIHAGPDYIDLTMTVDGAWQIYSALRKELKS